MPLEGEISDQQQVMLNLWTCVMFVFVALLQWGDGVKHFHWLRWTVQCLSQTGSRWRVYTPWIMNFLTRKKERSELRLQGQVQNIHEVESKRAVNVTFNISMYSIIQLTHVAYFIITTSVSCILEEISSCSADLRKKSN